MRISTHIKTRWTIRGDFDRDITTAWNNGTRVKLPNYEYGEARYDSRSGVALLSNGDKITTAITRYDHTEVIPLEKVSCIDCGKEFNQVRRCPSCGSMEWK